MFYICDGDLFYSGQRIHDETGLTGFPDITFLKPLGRGANAQVFLVDNRKLHREEVIKVYDPLKAPAIKCENEAIKNANIPGGLIADVYDARKCYASVPIDYIRMEYIKGISLKEWIGLKDEHLGKLKKLDPSHSDEFVDGYFWECETIMFSIAAGVFDAMSSYHKNEVTHGDPHEANIMIEYSLNPPFNPGTRGLTVGRETLVLSGEERAQFWSANFFPVDPGSEDPRLARWPFGEIYQTSIKIIDFGTSAFAKSEEKSLVNGHIALESLAREHSLMIDTFKRLVKGVVSFDKGWFNFEFCSHLIGKREFTVCKKDGRYIKPYDLDRAFCDLSKILLYRDGYRLCKTKMDDSDRVDILRIANESVLINAEAIY